VAAPPAKIGETDLPAWQRRLLALVETMRGGRLMLKANLIDKLAYDSLARTPFTQLSNLTLTPSMSVPLAMAPPIKGAPALPVGVQFMGRFGDDALLLQLAAQLEQAAPWSGRRP
jgi:amidase